MPFELVARISAYFNRNACYRQSMCQQTVLKYQIGLRETFSNSIYPEFMEKQDKSGA